ncbi:MAG: HD-GYP domain-containing protein [Chloroflexota bacterium]|nr:HD-GYP domain-containing protein [Chloroflexota bacterium]
MSELRPIAKLYLALVALLALGATLLALRVELAPTRDELVLAAVSTALLAAVLAFPFHYAFKMKMSLDTASIFAVTLLFAPGLAMLVVAIGMVLGHVISRRPWDEGLFNTSQAMLQAGVGGALLTLLGWNFNDLLANPPVLLLAALVAAAAMYLVTSLSVALMVAAQSGLSPWLVWRAAASFDAVEHSTQLALGCLVAVVVSAYPWALPLFAFPTLAVFRSGDREVRLRTQTMDAVEALADVVDIRDPYTANHSRRVAEYSREIATELGLAPGQVDLIERAARVHDIGKLVVDIAVLTKEGKLTEEEWEQLRAHPATGAEILSRFPQFALATSYVRHHHERMDGRGYPFGLAGEKIPLGARIIAVADSFDAMASARPYRSGLPMDVVLSQLRKYRGTQWDESAVDALLHLVESRRVIVPESRSQARSPVAA